MLRPGDLADQLVDAYLEKLGALEHRMRRKLQDVPGGLPDAVMPEPVETEDSELKRKRVKLDLSAASTQSVLPCVDFVDGKAVENQALRAARNGFGVGAELQLVKAISAEHPVDERLWVVQATKAGVRCNTRPDGKGVGILVPVNSLKHSTFVEPKKTKPVEESYPVPDGIAYSLASGEQTAAAIQGLSAAALFKLHSGCASGPKELVLCGTEQAGPLRCFAAAKAKEETIAILPFSTDVGFAKKSQSVKIQAEVTFGGRKQSFTLWAHAWTAHGSTRTADGDTPDSFPILWHVLGCEEEQYEGRDPVKLEWVVKDVKVPLMCQAEAPLKKASGRVDVLFKVPILTNATELHVGDFAWKLFVICFMVFFIFFVIFRFFLL